MESINKELLQALERSNLELERIRVNNWLGHGREEQVKNLISDNRDVINKAKSPRG